MKKILFAIIASLTFSIGAMAQEENKENRPERQQLDPAEMAQRRTDGMVKKYGLNDEQAKKLLELNTKFTGMMRPRGDMKRAKRPDGAAPDSTRKARPQRMERKGGRGEMSESMRKQMEEYKAGLKTILTEEQFNAYEADMKKGPRRVGGHREMRSEKE